MTFDPRNILVIDFGQLGDVVMSLPALRADSRAFSHARITVAVGKPGAEIIGDVRLMPMPPLKSIAWLCGMASNRFRFSKSFRSSKMCGAGNSIS